MTLFGFLYLIIILTACGFLFFKEKKQSKTISGYKVLMLLFNLIGKAATHSDVASDVMNFSTD